MRVEKRKILDLPAVYVTANLELDSKKYFAVASENRGEHAYIIDEETLQYNELWKGETGVMNIVQIPNSNKLLCITKFYPIFQSKDACINILEPSSKDFMETWNIREVLQLPFCHRIGVIRNKNGLFLLGCALCKDKDYQEDWTKPGALWASPIPVDRQNPNWKFSKVFDGLTKNHGLFIDKENTVYLASENGITKFDFSDYVAGAALYPVLLTTIPSSDLHICEMGGKQYLGVIEPFHGNMLTIYLNDGSNLTPIWSSEIDFGHAVWLGEVDGRKAVLVGNRGGKKQLKLIFWESNEELILEEGVGPTQVSVYSKDGAVRILSANHNAGEVTLYTLL